MVRTKKDVEKKIIRVKEFCIEDMPMSCTMIIIGPPGSGKTSFMEDIAYSLKHLYPVAKCFIGSYDAYDRFCKIFGSVYVSFDWNMTEEDNHIKRQKSCNRDYGKGYKGNYAINIIDDMSDDPKIYHTPTFRGLFKIGSQHWSQVLMIGSQYAIDMPPDIRKSVSYVALGREPEEAERKKLYDNFGGLAGSYNKFCDLMDQITGDHTFLVFNKRSQSNELEDCVFWYKTMDLAKIYPDGWSFGCDEYKLHHKRKYDPEYVQEFS